MALYYFDIIDRSMSQRDEVGTECASVDDVREAARHALPDIASDELRDGGDRRFFTVVARDAAGSAIYTATLAYSGVWLDRRP